VSFLRTDEFRCIIRTLPSEGNVFPSTDQLCILFHDELECTVRRLSDLDRYAWIDTDSKALDFVRLLTRPETSDAGLDEWLGAEVEWDGSLSCIQGRIPEDVLKQAHWGAAKVTADHSDWIIERTVLLRGGPFEPLKLATVTEHVSRRGDYRLVEAKERWRGELKGVAFPLAL
jgi:hypothetical protein